MDDVMDNLKVFSISTGEANAEDSAKVSGRTEIGAKSSRVSVNDSCDTVNTTTLMTLPIEIRAAISTHVLGNGHVHTRFDQNNHAALEPPKHRPRYTFCCDGFVEDLDLFTKNDGWEPLFPERRNPEQQRYKQGRFQSFEGGIPDFSHFPNFKTLRSVHEILRKYNATLVPFDDVQASLDPDAFDARLSVLAVCKHLRHEGLRALYSSNIFTFVDSYSFNTFMKHLTAGKASLIWKMELSLTFNCDKIDDYDVFENSGPQNIKSDWTVGGPGTRYENMWAALDGLTDLTIWVCDKVPSAYRPRSEWKSARETRLRRIRFWLRWRFEGVTQDQKGESVGFLEERV